MNFEEQATAMTKKEIAALLASNYELSSRNSELNSHNEALNHRTKDLSSRIVDLEHQLEWFRRQVFGEKSERRLLGANPSRQLYLGILKTEETPPPVAETIKSYERRKREKEVLPGTPDDSGLRFDPSVPVEVVPVPTPELDGLSLEEYEVIDEKVTYRLAQRPGSYVVLKYVRKVAKLRSSKEIVCPAAPPAVIERSFADVSFLAGLLIDKFCYHLPLYRQHQRLLACGIKLSRVTLTNLVHRAGQLLEPIYLALLSSILQSEVLTMDETPIKAGRGKQGKMHRGYFWPIYGDRDEIAFPFSPSRSGEAAREVLGQFCGTLVTDGYKVYERYVKAEEIVHAQCWGHARRYFEKATKVAPSLVSRVLDLIGQLYQIETEIRKEELAGKAKLSVRQQHSRPIVDEFFAWLAGVFQRHILLPSDPFTKAASYALEREAELRVFLDNPEVPIDTNHLEREIRRVAIGRKNYLFFWTEVGARIGGIIYSLIASCKLQEVDPYTYLVDVLQRIETHPIRQVHLLTPRLWKKNFAELPLRAELDKIARQ